MSSPRLSPLSTHRRGGDGGGGGGLSNYTEYKRFTNPFLILEILQLYVYVFIMIFKNPFTDKITTRRALVITTSINSDIGKRFGARVGIHIYYKVSVEFILEQFAP